MRKAGRVVAEMLEVTSAAARPALPPPSWTSWPVRCSSGGERVPTSSVTTAFPAVICTSPEQRHRPRHTRPYVLEDGDIISLDCGAIIEGYHGDAAVTVAVGDMPLPHGEAAAGDRRKSDGGVGQLVQGNRLHDVGLAVQTVAEGAGFSVVRGYVGHAIGTQMHEEPGVPNYWPGTPGPKLRTGMVFAVEPMVNVGAAETVLLDDGWTVVTADGSLSAHFEHTIAVTDDGPEVLTIPG